LRSSVLILFPGAGGGPDFAVNTKIGAEIKFSLRTANPTIAEAREAIAKEHLLRRFHIAEAGPAPVTHRQIVALAGVDGLAAASGAAGGPHRQRKTGSQHGGMLRVGWGHVHFERKILGFSTKGLNFFCERRPIVAEHPFIDLAKVNFPAAARRRVGWLRRDCLSRRPGPGNSAERIGRKLSKRGVSKVWNKLALATVLSTVSLNVAFADCCTTDLNAADRGQPAYAQANTCAYFLGQLQTSGSCAAAAR